MAKTTTSKVTATLPFHKDERRIPNNSFVLWTLDESRRPATEFCETSFSRELRNLLRLCGSAARLILRRVFDCVKYSGGPSRLPFGPRYSLRFLFARLLRKIHTMQQVGETRVCSEALKLWLNVHPDQLRVTSLIGFRRPGKRSVFVSSFNPVTARGRRALAMPRILDQNAASRTLN